MVPEVPEQVLGQGDEEWEVRLRLRLYLNPPRLQDISNTLACTPAITFIQGTGTETGTEIEIETEKEKGSILATCLRLRALTADPTVLQLLVDQEDLRQLWLAVPVQVYTVHLDMDGVTATAILNTSLNSSSSSREKGIEIESARGTGTGTERERENNSGEGMQSHRRLRRSIRYRTIRSSNRRVLESQCHLDLAES